MMRNGRIKGDGVGWLKQELYEVFPAVGIISALIGPSGKLCKLQPPDIFDA